MKIAFTVCSNNYLSQAKVLGDSLIANNPDYKFFIGLCDKKNEKIDYTFFEPHEIIEVEKLNIPDFEWMVYNYNIIELNTSAKPFYFQFFINKYKDLDIVLYFDPDIKIYTSLTIIQDELKNKSILLTPHITKPLPIDGGHPGDNTFLNYGLYNLGFLGVRPCPESETVLRWWNNILYKQCFDKVYDGYFVDQLPFNYAPLFFKNVKVSYNPGANFAYWNFHERTLSQKDNRFIINDKFPLLFAHFSSFKPVNPLLISKYQSRFKLEERTILYDLFSEYYSLLIENKYMELISIPCYYVEMRKRDIQENLKKKKSEIKLRNKIYNLINRCLLKIFKIV